MFYACRVRSTQAERRGIVDIYRKYGHIGDLEARIRTVALEVGIDPISVRTYLLAAGLKVKGLTGLYEKLRLEKKGKQIPKPIHL